MFNLFNHSTEWKQMTDIYVIELVVLNSNNQKHLTMCKQMINSK